MVRMILITVMAIRYSKQQHNHAYEQQLQRILLDIFEL